jgi:hypothetical protein
MTQCAKSDMSHHTANDKETGALDCGKQSRGIAATHLAAMGLHARRGTRDLFSG